LADVLLGAA